MSQVIGAEILGLQLVTRPGSQNGEADGDSLFLNLLGKQDVSGETQLKLTMNNEALRQDPLTLQTADMLNMLELSGKYSVHSPSSERGLLAEGDESERVVSLSEIGAIFTDKGQPLAGNKDFLRLLPMSSIGKGVLSYQQFVTVGEVNDMSVSLDRVKGGQLNVASNLNTVVFDYEGYQKQEGRSVNIASTQSLMSGVYRQQDRYLNEVDIAQKSALGLIFELGKRSALITDHTQYSVLWIRDYHLSEAQKHELIGRLQESDYSEQNNIHKIYLNGQLVWNNEEETL